MSPKFLKIIFYVLLLVFVFVLALVLLKAPRRGPSAAVSSRGERDFYQSCQEGFKWGVGVAPYDIAGVSASEISDWRIAKPVLDLAKELGVNYVRIGVPDWAMDRLDQLMVPVVDYANQIGLNVILGFDTPAGNPVKLGADVDRYSDGKHWGEQIARRFRGKVCYYQISNEVTGTAIKPDWPGTAPDHFDELRYQQVEDWLRGAIDGINLHDRQAKKIITGHWLGFGFFERAIESGLEFDAIGWHWYEKDYSLEEIASDGKIYNISEILAGFGKELMITEAGWAGDESASDWEREQARFITSFAKRIYADSRYSGFFPLTIIDQAPLPGKEKTHFGGLVEPALEDRRWVVGKKREAFEALKAVIDESP